MTAVLICRKGNYLKYIIAFCTHDSKKIILSFGKKYIIAPNKRSGCKTYMSRRFEL